MALFDDKELKKRVQYLEEERKKLWDRVVKLEDEDKAIRNEIVNKASESQKDAFQFSKKAAEYKNKTEDRLKEAIEKIGEITSKVNEADRLVKTITSNNEIIIELKTKAELTDSEFEESYNKLKEKVDHLTSFIEEYPELDEKLADINKFIEDIEGNLLKSRTSLTTINTRKKEIDEYYQELFGYEDEDDNGETVVVEGKKDVLDTTYEDLEEKLTKAENRIISIKRDFEANYKNFEEEHKTNYSKINEEIASLLPAALTAGLSSAFSTKKIEEETNLSSMQIRFSKGIYLLITASLIPFVVSIVLMYRGESLDQVIFKIPRMVLAIIPMYIPILWFTYSANKKLNLSKRLIEEYAHKEVLSKTYEGLSKQINNLDNDEQTSELKYRLLSNFLQVTSENPGKLISNYESSDHPVMEALEQSYKFQLAIDKLDGIPGLGKVAAILESNSKKKLEEKGQKIEKILSGSKEESSPTD
ncbi:hypothetical protein [Sphingobacterium sp. DR205]|uniref:hypothetical protein n=1 Tax=Sphingobacterium sp. DR205 TaxID=2713573 RepID=UPI0013E4B13A|nr:hypothetical protein [Sphingobacterium sp. DR205]QIH35506.1 hypothetical protein G6053_22665 [Sphingobacterium sp. DR205]